MVRGALRALLAMEEDIQVVAEAARADEVVRAAIASRPDVALLDIEMPGGDGISSAAALHDALPHCRSLILTTFGKPGFLRRAMETGAYGFLLKDAPPEQLAHAIRRTAQGERIVDPGLAASALSDGVSPLKGNDRCSPRPTVEQTSMKSRGRCSFLVELFATTFQTRFKS